MIYLYFSFKLRKWRPMEHYSDHRSKTVKPKKSKVYLWMAVEIKKSYQFTFYFQHTLIKIIQIINSSKKIISHFIELCVLLIKIKSKLIKTINLLSFRIEMTSKNFSIKETVHKNIEKNQFPSFSNHRSLVGWCSMNYPKVLVNPIYLQK